MINNKILEKIYKHFEEQRFTNEYYVFTTSKAKYFLNKKAINTCIDFALKIINVILKNEQEDYSFNAEEIKQLKTILKTQDKYIKNAIKNGDIKIERK